MSRMVTTYRISARMADGTERNALYEHEVTAGPGRYGTLINPNERMGLWRMLEKGMLEGAVSVRITIRPLHQLREFVLRNGGEWEEEGFVAKYRLGHHRHATNPGWDVLTQDDWATQELAALK